MSSERDKLNSSDRAALEKQVADLKAKIETLEKKFATLQSGQAAALAEINEALATLELYLQKLR